ncbi:cysteine/serine endopeptidase inhibitor [Cystobacter fuscus]|uniref:cysteine/serine endopeptidase inhibitor n=1 Tax=Cystobacter fuscus TaxID=43 RepID=UPI0037C037C4
MKKRFAALIITLAATAAVAATASVSFKGNGKLSYYNAAGHGACGTQINAASELFAAVPSRYWTASNPTQDPLCEQSVLVTYKGKSIKVPVRDRCPGCSADKLDLGQPAFQELANLDVGVIKGASWSIVAR